SAFTKRICDGSTCSMMFQTSSARCTSSNLNGRVGPIAEAAEISRKLIRRLKPGAFAVRRITIFSQVQGAERRSHSFPLHARKDSDRKAHLPGAVVIRRGNLIQPYRDSYSNPTCIDNSFHFFLQRLPAFCESPARQRFHHRVEIHPLDN